MQHGVEQWHVYLKPTRPELETNLALNTDRRSYLLELHSYADTYMAAVEWHYPEDEIARLQSQADELATEQRNPAPVAASMRSTSITRFRSSKARPRGPPYRSSTTGGRSSAFPRRCSLREAPALFVLRDKETQLVNYRVQNDFYVVDRLFDARSCALAEPTAKRSCASSEPIRVGVRRDHRRAHREPHLGCPRQSAHLHVTDGTSAPSRASRARSHPQEGSRRRARRRPRRHAHRLAHRRPPACLQSPGAQEGGERDPPRL